MTQTFDINHSDKEYLLSVEGSYDKSGIQSIQFRTNKKTSDLMGFSEGTKFSLSASEKNIIGFHGFSEKNLKSLGTYFMKDPPTGGSQVGSPPIRGPPIKSEIGGAKNTGNVFDDGGDYDGVKKVLITYDNIKIRHMKVDYDKAGQVVSREHGTKEGTQYEFKVDYPSEYITSVEGTYAINQPYGTDILRSLTFKTSKGRTSPIIGRPAGSFMLQRKGSAIVGFHGRCGGSLDGIGAYYSPSHSSPLVKLEAQGGDGGNSWDDGGFQNVKKIYIGQGEVGIASVKFEYENEASEVVVGGEHGKKTLLGFEEVKLDYPSEYIISVEGCYDKVMGAETGVITMLKFKTNKRTSPPFGLEAGWNFLLQKEGHKITGFHGKSSDVLHQIGVHVVPIA